MTPSNSETGHDTTASTARHEASSVASHAQRAGRGVAETAQGEASRVAHEATGQAKRMLHEVGDELRSQAGVQQHRAAEGLRSVGSELRTMASNSEQQGLASDVASQIADRANSLASWLDAREPGSLVQEVKSFARRRPGAFIAIAAGAGIVVGRLAKAVTESAREESSSGTTPTDTTSTPAIAPPPPYLGEVAEAPLYEETVTSQGGDYRP